MPRHLGHDRHQGRARAVGWMRAHERPIGRLLRRGLTLAELVVVIAILGILASALFPSAAYVLSRAREQDARARAVDSWRLARATALASGEPVWWEARQTDEGVELTVRTIGESVIRRKNVLSGWRLQAGDGEVTAVARMVLIAPHGLSEAVSLTMARVGEPGIKVDLPGVIDDSQAVGNQSRIEPAASMP